MFWSLKAALRAFPDLHEPDQGGLAAPAVHRRLLHAVLEAQGLLHVQRGLLEPALRLAVPAGRGLGFRLGVF